MVVICGFKYVRGNWTHGKKMNYLYNWAKHMASILKIIVKNVSLYIVYLHCIGVQDETLVFEAQAFSFKLGGINS